MGANTLGERDLLAEDLSRKFFDSSLLDPPRSGREASLDARLVEESLAVPSILSGHLRQKQACEAAFADNQAVSADLDFGDIPNGLDRPRSEERRVGKEWRSRVSPEHVKKRKK